MHADAPSCISLNIHEMLSNAAQNGHDYKMTIPDKICMHREALLFTNFKPDAFALQTSSCKTGISKSVELRNDPYGLSGSILSSTLR